MVARAVGIAMLPSAANSQHLDVAPFIRDIAKLKKVPKVATGCALEMSHISYPDRLDRLKLVFLRRWRLRRDLKKTLKNLRGYVSAESRYSSLIVN